MTIEILIRPGGDAAGLYDEAFDFGSLGQVQIRRAGLVEPDRQSRWWADLVAPAADRSSGFPHPQPRALAVEVAWLSRHAVLAHHKIKEIGMKQIAGVLIVVVLVLCCVSSCDRGWAAHFAVLLWRPGSPQAQRR